MKNFISVITTSLHNVLIAIDSIESVVSNGKYSDYVVITMKSGDDTYTVIDKYCDVVKHIAEAQE